jgi:hypothetical protein
MAVAALLVLLGACSGDQVTDTDCQRVFITTCNHQVACDLAPDFASCNDELTELFICDFDKTKEQFKACIRAEDTPCTQSMSAACFEVTCSKSIGCVDVEHAHTGAEF